MNERNQNEEMYLSKEIQLEYLEFLDDEHEGGKYHARTKTMIDEKEKRLIVNVNDLRKKNPNRAEGSHPQADVLPNFCYDFPSNLVDSYESYFLLYENPIERNSYNLLNNSFEEVAIFQRALKEYVSGIDPTYSKEADEFFLGFEGNFGNKHVTPRNLNSQFLGNLICVEGIVTKCSLAKLKIIRSVHYCPTTGKFLERKYADITSLDAFPSSTTYPTKDDQGNLLETEFGLSLFKDHQTLTIQEMPEKAPPGQLPRSVDIICDNDLVDACKPGDRIRVIGCYRCLPGKHGGFTSGVFRTVIIANSITPMTSEVHERITRADMNVFRKIAKRKDVFELLSRSLAPSIHGHDYVKKAILCLLVGGCEKLLSNGTRLRGDINVLLIGDPGVAKSQLLRFVLQSAPRAIPTTGRGSSGVGLTAAVTTDPETGERRLEAGAMVLADRGVVCIDEFDKMSDMDRTAIHEVMEQGKVTISKAGIHARLNARCSVLAAANPVYGKYNQYKTPMENIGLQDSLLSRFDLLFVLLDIVDTEDDKRIADHVVRMHRYRNPLEQDGDVMPMGSGVDFVSMEEEKSKGNRGGVDEDDEDDEDDEAGERYKIFEKFNALLHAGNRSHRDQILSIPFIKKYVHMCKNIRPALTEEAAEVMSEEYARLRSQDAMSSDVARTQPITVRTLETLIRLATARAKVRFSRKVNVDDAKMAVELVQYAMFRKVLDKREKKKRHRNDDEEREVDLGEEGENGEGGEGQQRSKRQRSSPVDEFESVSSQEEPPPSLTQMREQSRIQREKKLAEAQVAVSEERLKTFRDAIVKIFMDARELSLPLPDVMEALNARPDRFSQAEVDACFELLSDQNRIMLSENTVFLI